MSKRKGMSDEQVFWIVWGAVAIAALIVLGFSA